MSILAPLYFLGALAIGLPILFHLIRRQPKGQVEFSSLIFLRPTPPRLTRRSRLDNWPLLLLRALVLLLLAAAFTRPFLRTVAWSDTEIPGRRLVLVVDKSASMQRSGLWQQALDRASDLINDLRGEDELAVVVFDRAPTTLMSFEQSSRLTPDQVQATVTKLLKDVTPSWHATETGRAISYAADMAVTVEPEDTAGLAAEPTAPAVTTAAHVVLISDMQAGSQIESLQTFAWPDHLRLDVRSVTPQDRTNASLTILNDIAADDEEVARDAIDRVRVRVTNAKDSTDSRFLLAWTGGTETSELPVQVPPGESRVVRMPKPAPGVTSIVLRGDSHSFDNIHYLISPEVREYSLGHVGSEPENPRDSLLYYLQRVPLNNPYRSVQVETFKPEQIADPTRMLDPLRIPLIVVEDAVSAESAARLKQYVSAGGRLLMVLADEQRAAGLVASVNSMLGSQLQVSEAKVADYVMLSKIDFRSAVFAAMSDPKFNDFTKVRFWSHRTISGLTFADQGEDRTVEDQDEVEAGSTQAGAPEANLLASFDDGDPAFVQWNVDEGQLLLLAAGWQPEESQLALSTKFIPLVFSLFESGWAGREAGGFAVGDPLPFSPAENATITDPAGIETAFRTSADLDSISQPGVYQFRDGDVQQRFAVNLQESESHTETLGDEVFERFDVVLGKTETTAQSLTNQRQLRDLELESRQRMWQWLLLAALGLIGLETWWGARLSRRREFSQPTAT